jgi:general secretion pathway protein J
MKPKPLQVARTARSPQTACHGFTLVEVMVALAIMGILAALAWRGLDSMDRVRAWQQKQLDLTLNIDTVLSQWEHDLRALQDPGVLHPLRFDGAQLRLLRAQADGLQLVVWALRPDPQASDGSYRLQRWASRPVTQAQEIRQLWNQSLQFQGQEPGQLTVLRGLTQWQVYLFRGNAWTNAQSSGDWQAQRDPATVGPVGPPSGASKPDAPKPPDSGASAPANPAVFRELLPQGVRLQLTFSGQGGRSGQLVRDLFLNSGAP